MIQSPNKSIVNNYGVHKAVVTARAIVGSGGNQTVLKIQVWIPSYHKPIDEYKINTIMIGTSSIEAFTDLPWASCSEDVSVGDVVWVAFSGGDLRYPVYVSSAGVSANFDSSDLEIPSFLTSTAYDLLIDSGSGSTYSVFPSGGRHYGSGTYEFIDPVVGFQGSYNAKWIFDYLIQTELPVAAVVGILGYMYGESHYQIDVVSFDGVGLGLCQWTYFWREFVAAVPDWRTNGYAQLDYMMEDLRTRCKQLYNILLSVPNTQEGVYIAAGRFSTHYGGGLPIDEDLETVINRYDTIYYGTAKEAHIDIAVDIWNNNLKFTPDTSDDGEPSSADHIMTQKKFLNILNYACDSVKTEYCNVYPNNVGYIIRYENGQPVYGFDCSGLIKGILRGWDARYGIANYKYTSKVIPPDTDTEGLYYDYCYNRSSNLDPNTITPGEMLHMKGHVGVYVGNNRVIESTGGFEHKVQRTYLINQYPHQNWTGHGKLPWIDYTNGKKSGGGGGITPEDE